jgi:hypothetical protein
MQYTQWTVDNGTDGGNGTNPTDLPVPIAPTRAENLPNFISYQNMMQGKEIVNVAINNDNITQVLLCVKWSWQKIDGKYVQQFWGDAIAGV